jgi:hypothetical protein
MFNDIENQTNDPEEQKIIKNLKLLTWMTVLLGILRIISLDIMMIFSDLLSALMIYFYAQSRNKCMAIFCGINGAIGMIYAVIKFFSSWTTAKHHWFSLYYNCLVCIAIYAMIVYSVMIYYAYIGWNRYQMISLQIPRQESSNYGSVSTDQKPNYIAFGGKGTTIGN